MCITSSLYSIIRAVRCAALACDLWARGIRTLGFHKQGFSRDLTNVWPGYENPGLAIPKHKLSHESKAHLNDSENPCFQTRCLGNTPNPPTNIVGFRGFDSSAILILRVGISRPIGNFLESLNQAMLVGYNVSREIGRREYRSSSNWAACFGSICPDAALSSGAEYNIPYIYIYI